MAYDSSLVVYNSVPLTNINVTPGMDLQIALQNIDFAVGTTIIPNYSLFNYGPYYGYTLYDPLGNSITTITGFVEGTANGIGKVSSDLATFIGTTYATNQSVITTAITALSVPGLSYVHSAGGLSISIANTDNQLTILTKLANGLGDTGDLLAEPGNTWPLLSLSQQVNIKDAFNSLINYNVSQDTAIAGKEAAIGTFDNSANCLTSIGGTSADDAGTTIDLLTQYVCSLDKFDAAPINLTVTCLTPQADLQDWVAYIVNILESNATSSYVAVDSSMTVTSLGACSGNRIGVDPTWSGLSNVATSVQDTTPGTLTDKLVAGTNVTLTPSAPGNQTLTIDVALPNESKVAINSLDVTPDYLAAKITPAQGDWGLSTSILTSTNNDQLIISTVMADPFTFVQNFINYISTDPTLLAAFCALKTQCDGCQCLAATAFTVSADLVNSEFDLTWAVGTSLGETQTVAYREQGATAWISSANITAANPQTYTTTSAVVANLNTNTVYEFQIVSNCGTGPNYSAIVTGIIYEQQTPLSYGVNSTLLSVNQASMPTVDIVEYALFDNNNVLIENAAPVSGLNPVVQFTTPVSPATNYYVNFRYGTLINGVTLYSDDPSQHGSWYSQSITTP